ncbi:MAG: flagellar basal body rod protein FlgC [Rhodospirillales bacterium]|nr:MAG: flagellar basal body rod protein FlgC [Rhodospirillales bacterium]
MDDMMATMKISAAGMKVQGTRLRVIAENLANVDSLPASPDALPYRRKVITFRDALDRSTGLNHVRVDAIGNDDSPFKQRYEPGHPAANADGYVLAPNVSGLTETMDMREAQRSYEANLTMIRTAKGMMRDALDVLR